MDLNDKQTKKDNLEKEKQKRQAEELRKNLLRRKEKQRLISDIACHHQALNSKNELKS